MARMTLKAIDLSLDAVERKIDRLERSHEALVAERNRALHELADLVNRSETKQ